MWRKVVLLAALATGCGGGRLCIGDAGAPCAVSAPCHVGRGGAPPKRAPHARPPEQFVQSTHWNTVTTLAFSDDGRFLASASYDHTVRVWDVARLRELRMFPFDGEVTSLAWDGEARLMIGRAREHAVLVNVLHGAARAEVGASSGFPGPYHQKGEGGWLLWAPVTPWNAALSLFDDDGNRVKNLTGEVVRNTSAVVIAPDASAVGVASTSDPPVLLKRDGGGYSPVALKLPDPKDATPEVLVPAPGGAEAVLLVNEAGKLYVVGDHAPRAIAIAPEASIERAVPSRDAVSVAVLSRAGPWARGALSVFDGRTGEARFAAPPGASAAAFTADGATLAVGDDGGGITLFDTLAGLRVGELGHRIVRPVTLRFDGRTLVSESCESVMRWSLDTGALLGRDAVPCDAARTEKLRAEAGRRASGPLPPIDGAISGAAGTGGVTFAGTADGSLAVIEGGHVVARGGSDGLGVHTLAVSPADDVVASISSDGMIRIWDAETAAVRALFILFDDDEWLATTPRGAYVGSAEVSDRIGWVYDEPLELHPFAQFKRAFESPDRVRRRLLGEDVEAPRDVPRPPSIALVRATPAGAGSRVGSVRVAVGSESRVDVVRVFVEARLAAEARACREDGQVDLDVPLRPGRNHVSVVAFDDRGFASNELPVELEGPKGEAAKPDVWVVAVGVSAYPHLLDGSALPAAPRAEALAGFQLPAARRDAASIAATFSAMAGPGGPYARAHATVLTDEGATPDAMRAALEGLRAMRPADVGIVFFAGHGFKDGPRGDMVLVTGAARLTPDRKAIAPDARAAGAMGWRDLADALSATKGRVMVLLDACHAGHVTQELVAPNGELASRLLHDGRAGAIVFAASKGRQSSYEGEAARGLEAVTVGREAHDEHGLFTAALLESLGDASTDRNRDGTLEASELIDATTRRVVATSGGRQTPWVARREVFGDFAVGARRK